MLFYKPIAIRTLSQSPALTAGASPFSRRIGQVRRRFSSCPFWRMKSLLLS